MSFGKSSLHNIIYHVLAFTLVVQKTAAQSMLCGQYQTLNSTSGQYIIQNNAWGADDSGSQCTTVEDEKNGSAFSTTWIWGANDTYASQTQVHSYPNVKSNSNTLPVMLSNITALTVSANWTMYPSGTGNQAVFDTKGLNAISAKADVILDFFLDPDIKQSTNVTNPKYEVMIFLGSLGATEPIGYFTGSTGGTVLDGKNYTFYTGQNNQTGQEVFSFVAPTNTTSLSQLDIFPLFQYLVDGNKMPSSTYLGTAQFGTETFHTDGKNVTFSATGVGMTVQPKSLPPAKKSQASSLNGVQGFWYLVKGVVGAWMLWSLVL